MVLTITPPKGIVKGSNKHHEGDMLKIKVSVGHSEKQEIESAAKKMSLSVSAFIRMAALQLARAGK
jgi:hypothetical protein